jgi:hypothetical protein
MNLRLVVGVVLILLAAYGVFRALPLIEGPQITLTSPKEGENFPGGFVAISGISRHTQNLSLDGAPLLIDPKGRFSTTLVLPAGSAILTLTATDRFGKSETIERTIYIP